MIQNINNEYAKGFKAGIKYSCSEIRKGIDSLALSPWANDKRLIPFNIAYKEILDTINDLCIKKVEKE